MKSNFQTDLKYVDSSISCSGDGLKNIHWFILTFHLGDCYMSTVSAKFKKSMKLNGNELVLVGGSGYIFRAYYALPPMFRSDGNSVNTVLVLQTCFLN